MKKYNLRDYRDGKHIPLDEKGNKVDPDDMGWNYDYACKAADEFISTLQKLVREE